jgi:YVTN family beta-propeller protein
VLRTLALVAAAFAIEASAVGATAESQIVAKIRVGFGPCLSDAAFGYVWVTTNTSSTVVRVNPATNEARGAVKVGGGPCGIVHGAGSLWIDG